jgi:hypothetical protein
VRGVVGFVAGWYVCYCCFMVPLYTLGWGLV